MENSVAKRRAEKTAEIVASAWALARADGIAGVTLHGLARVVGMRQPSLYVYFDSKLALYDAMFADGNRRLLERLDAVALSPEPREALKQWLHAFAAFGSEDAELYQLLLHRPIPGFTPSAESYTLMRAAGVTEQGDMDCIVAITAGTFRHGRDGGHVEIDAIDFIRTLPGRRPGSGVLSNPLPL